MPQGFFFGSSGVSQEKFDDFKLELKALGVYVDPYNRYVSDCAYWVLYNSRGVNYFYGISISEDTLKNNYLYTKETFDTIQYNIYNILSQIESYGDNEFDKYYSQYSLNDSYIIKTILGISDQTESKKEKPTMESVKTKPQTKFKFSDEVSKFLKDMKEYAKHGDYGKVIGRDSEVGLMIKTLSRHKKANPLLVGESGCGKTSIVEDLAYKLVNGDKSIPESMKDIDLYEVDLNEIVGGTSYRGMMEERVTNIFKEANSHGNCIIFFDEIHQVKNKSSDSAPDIGNMLKKHLTNKNIRVIGATTYKEYKNTIEKDPALPRRFHKIEVLEPSLEDTKLIIKGIKKTYEIAHNVKYSNNVIDYICELSSKYIHNQHSPDREIDIIDLVGVETKLLGKKQVTIQTVEKVIANKTRISIDKIGKESTNIIDLNQEIKKSVFGQDKAIDELTNLIKIGMSGLKEQNKPIANLLFCGKTGTGKTETVKSLADNLGVNVLRLDMSEYSDKTAVNKLIGSSSGYVGYEEGGLLTEWLSRNPSGIILLDEVEKSDTSVFNLLLQMFDEGHITDNQGRKMMCNNHIIIMTSNVGARQAEEVKNGIGLIWEDKKEKESQTINKALKDTFAPEFLARLDGVCEFDTIDEDVAKMIIFKFIRELKDRSGIKISISSKVVDKLIEDGFDDKMGARPLKAIIKKNITLNLADMILSGEKEKEVFVDYVDDEYKVVSKKLVK